MRFSRAATIAALLLAFPNLALSQALTPLQGLVLTGSPPTGFAGQNFEYFCNASNVLCWPQMQLWDGTTRATVNANGGLNTNILGTLPSFASTPTVNLGTIGTAATQTTLAAILTAIGTPMQQTGGTVNLGTIGGVATQTTLAAILTALGTPAQAGGTTPVITAANVTAGDCSGSITATGVAQNITNLGTTSIHGAMIMNIDPVTGSGEALWVNPIGTAVVGAVQSAPIAPPVSAPGYIGMGSWTFPPGFGTNHAVSIIGTIGHKYTCWFW